MKLNEIILAATEHDLAGCDADSILARAKQMPARRKLAGWKKVLIIAAAACLFVGTASAAVLLSGFGTAFERPVDTGHVEMLDASSNNKDLVWTFTETWFDENMIYLGGTVTTPEPLDPAGDYRVSCGIKIPGAEAETYSGFLNVYIYAVGERESAFLMSGNLLRQGSDFMTQARNEDGSVTLELTLCYFQDYRFAPVGESYTSDDIEILFPGQWIYTVRLQSADASSIRVDGRYESLWPGRSLAVVTSVKLTAFSLTIEGEDLTYLWNAETGERAILQAWLKMKDGTLLFKPRGNFANNDSDVHYRERTDESIIYLFSDPIDPGEVESVILYEAWGITPTNPAVEEYYRESGWEFYPSIEPSVSWAERTEGWRTIIEIPLS